MAKQKINIKDYDSLEDFEKAAGRKASALEASMFGAKKNAEKAMSAGITNDKGQMSLANNKGAKKIVDVYDEKTIDPEMTKQKFVEVNNQIVDTLKQMDGKSEEEQEKIAEEAFPSGNKKVESPVKKAVEQIVKKTEEPVKETSPKEEPAKPMTEAEEKRNSFLESWAATHPTWAQILKSKDLTFGQKVALIGGALANIGANVTLGAKSGFEHSGFTPVEWDFKKAIDKYSNQEIESVLGSEQGAKAKEKYASYFSDMADKYGPEKMDEMFQIVDTYGDNPQTLKARLEALGIKEDAEEIKKAYATREKVSAQEQAKRDKLDTEIKSLEADLKRIQNSMANMDEETKRKTYEKIIEAQNAINKYNKTKYSSDATTYNLEKAAGYVRNILREAEGAASTVGGVMTGGLVGGVKDGIIKGKGIPQKIVRADGSEIALDPNDNIYATKNAITTESDNGADIIPMELDDFITYQNRLGYEGGIINKDFEYYLKKLEAC